MEEDYEEEEEEENENKKKEKDDKQYEEEEDENEWQWHCVERALVPIFDTRCYFVRHIVKRMDRR